MGYELDMFALIAIPIVIGSINRCMPMEMLVSFLRPTTPGPYHCLNPLQRIDSGTQNIHMICRLLKNVGRFARRSAICEAVVA